jgi:hypothetical protein
VSDDANAAESFTSGAACGTLRQGESPAANDVVIEWGEEVMSKAISEFLKSITKMLEGCVFDDALSGAERLTTGIE